MASPNFDSLNIQHSRNIGDAILTAGASGNRFTSAQRTYHLNTGIKRWLLMQTSLKNYNALLQYVSNAQGITSTVDGNSIFLLAGILNIISVLCDSKIIKRGDEKYYSQYQLAEGNTNSFLKPSLGEPVYIYADSKLNIYPAIGFTGKNITIHYVKQHTDLSVNGDVDIIVPSQYWHQILDLALIEAMNETPNEVAFARAKDKSDVVSKEEQLLSNSQLT